MTTHKLPDLVHDLAEAALRLALVLGDAEEIQWDPSTAPKARDDTSQRSKGGYTDPTATTVIDPGRLAVRDAVKNTEAFLVETTEELRGQRARLEAAIAAWGGDDRP